MIKRKLTRSIGFVLLLLLAINVTQAQQTFAVTAREALDLALKNVIELKNLNIDYKIQEAQNKEITGQAYPQLNGNISGSHYFAIPVTTIPDFISPAVYGVLDKEGVKDGNGNPITLGSLGPTQYFPARFGVPWAASAGFTLQQILFQSDVFVGLKARSTALEYAQQNIKVSEDKVKQNVATAYYAVLIAQKQLQLTNESKVRLQKLSHDNQIMFQNGFAEKLDIDRVQVSLNNIESAIAQLENVVKLGYAGLKQNMGLTQRDSVILKDSLNIDLLKADILDEGSFKYEDRSEIRLLSTSKRLAELDLQRYKLSYVPTLSAFWNFSESAQRNDFDFIRSGKQYPWFQTSQVGVNVNIPIFDGFQKSNRVKQAQFRLDKLANSLDQTKMGIDLQQVSTKGSLKANILAFDIQKKNLELAESVYNTTKKKFEQGVGSSFEVIQAENDLQTAQGNYFDALYKATLAKIDYLRALGRL